MSQIWYCLRWRKTHGLSSNQTYIFSVITKSKPIYATFHEPWNQEEVNRWQKNHFKHRIDSSVKPQLHKQPSSTDYRPVSALNALVQNFFYTESRQKEKRTLFQSGLYPTDWRSCLQSEKVKNRSTLNLITGLRKYKRIKNSNMSNWFEAGNLLWTQRRQRLRKKTTKQLVVPWRQRKNSVLCSNTMCLNSTFCVNRLLPVNLNSVWIIQEEISGFWESRWDFKGW